jgi:hypothetical protein
MQEMHIANTRNMVKMNPDVNFYATGIQTIVKSGDCHGVNVDTGNLFDDIVDSRHSEADFFSEPWMYRLKESSPYSGSTSLRHFFNLDLCIPLY